MGAAVEKSICVILPTGSQIGNKVLKGLDSPSSTMPPASEQDIFPFDPVLCIVPFLFAQFAQGHMMS